MFCSWVLLSPSVSLGSWCQWGREKVEAGWFPWKGYPGSSWFMHYVFGCIFCWKMSCVHILLWSKPLNCCGFPHNTSVALFPFDFHLPVLLFPSSWIFSSFINLQTQASFLTLLSTLCSRSPSVVNAHLQRISTSVFGLLHSMDTKVCQPLWEAVLQLVTKYPVSGRTQKKNFFCGKGSPRG